MEGFLACIIRRKRPGFGAVLLVEIEFYMHGITMCCICMNFLLLPLESNAGGKAELGIVGERHAHQQLINKL